MKEEYNYESIKRAWGTWGRLEKQAGESANSPPSVLVNFVGPKVLKNRDRSRKSLLAVVGPIYRKAFLNILYVSVHVTGLYHQIERFGYVVLRRLRVVGHLFGLAGQRSKYHTEAGPTPIDFI
jgi:hypothetical protein